MYLSIYIYVCVCIYIYILTMIIFYNLNKLCIFHIISTISTYLLKWLHRPCFFSLFARPSSPSCVWHGQHPPCRRRSGGDGSLAGNPIDLREYG